jgi:type I restriction enzyme R subunit
MELLNPTRLHARLSKSGWVRMIGTLPHTPLENVLVERSPECGQHHAFRPQSAAPKIGQLSDRGYDQDRLEEIRRLVDAPDSDLFDVLSHVMYTTVPKTRSDRADSVRTASVGDTTGDMQTLLMSILSAYELRGESELATKKLGSFLTARFGSVSEGKAKLGGLPAVRDAFRKMQSELYSG